MGANMTSILTRLAAVTVLALATTASAQDSRTMMSGADFLSACSRPDPEWIGFCHGYVQAVVDGVRAPRESFCAPGGTTRAEIVGAVVDQLTKTPDLQKLNAASVVYSVLVKAYPCR